MSCLPESGGCERPFTDAFVNHLNQSEGRQYLHRACLDIHGTGAPQPEALYVEPDTDLQLVIERKSISWPIDYPYRHSNDHFISQVLSDALKGLKVDDLYEVRFPMLIQGKREQLRGFVLRATDKIRANWAKVESGIALTERVNENWWWSFRRVPSSEREDNSPSAGLQVTWVGRSMMLEDWLSPSEPPDDLASTLQNIYSACVAKFAAYTIARRVLVLDPHGDLRHHFAEWWHELWTALPPPPVIDEIWSGIFDYVDDETQDWQFERLR